MRRILLYSIRPVPPVSGLSQFPVTVIIGLGFLYLLGYSLRGGMYDLIYLAACCALSSTAIVVKLLPHLLVAAHLIETLTMILKKEHNEMSSVVKREIRMLEERSEILQ